MAVTFAVLKRLRKCVKVNHTAISRRQCMKKEIRTHAVVMSRESGKVTYYTYFVSKNGNSYVCLFPFYK